MLEERYKNATKENNKKCFNLCNLMITTRYEFRVLSIDANNGK